MAYYLISFFVVINFLNSNAFGEANYIELMEDYRKNLRDSNLDSAEKNLNKLLEKYPVDIEIRTLKSNMYFMKKEFRKSIISFNAIDLDSESDKFIDRKNQIFLDYLYDKNIKLIQKYIQNKEFDKAINTIDYLLEYLIDNKELLVIKANIFYWKKEYQKSIDIYNKLKDLTEEENNKFNEIKNIYKINELETLIDKKPEIYEKELKSLFDNKIELYESGYRLSMFYIKKRNFDKSLNILESLIKSYPEDIGINEMYIETLILNNYNQKAQEFVKKLNKTALDKIKERREDIFYNLYKDKVNFTYEHFRSDNVDYPNENYFSLFLKKQLWNFTIVPRIDNITRFDKNDTNFSLGLNYNFGTESKRNIETNFTYSLNSNFSPTWNLNGTFYQGFSFFEVFAGYNRMIFPRFSIDIMIPGVIVYLPFRFSLEEKLYLIPNIKSISSLTTLNWAYNHRLNLVYRFAYGTTPDVVIIDNNVDINNLENYLNNLSISYKLNPNINLILSGTINSFKDKFTRYGLSSSVEYLW